MDKELLAIVGRLYLENMSLINFSESLKARIDELEKLLTNKSANQEFTDSAFESRN